MVCYGLGWKIKNQNHQRDDQCTEMRERNKKKTQKHHPTERKPSDAMQEKKCIALLRYSATQARIRCYERK